MGTRSRIGIQGKNGITSVYCHWDGYPEHNGQLLIDHYTSVTKIEQLMKLGNLSKLGRDIGDKQDFNHPTDDNWCIAYGRDRGERLCAARKHIDLEAFFDAGEEFNYLFINGKWNCYDAEKNPINLYEKIDNA